MLELKTALQQKPYLFSDIARQWRQTTGGTLAVLSPGGEIIAGNNGLLHNLDELVAYSASGELKVIDPSQTIITPLIVDGEIQGHLISRNALQEQLPMLSLVGQMFAASLSNEQALEGMTDELIAAWDQLDLVYRINQILAEKSTLTEALNSLLKELINVAKVENGFILLSHNNVSDCVTAGLNPIRELVSRKSFVDKLARLNHLVLCNDYNKLLDFWPQAPAEFRNFIGTAITTGDKTTATVGLINKNQRVFTAGDVKLITAISEQIKAIIDSYRLQQELIAQERVQRELEIAAEIQESLLPKIIPEINGLTIDVSSMPAFEVGGDFYDFISPDGDNLTIVVGDVAGKGVPAAMFTSMVRTMLRIEAFHSQEPHIIIKRVNEILHQDLWQAELFVTAFVSTFDTKNNVLMYANAGHTPGIIYHAQSQKSRLLKATSLPIGIFGYDYKITQYVHLSPGDTLVLYSDGISEAQNPAGERFGIQRIQHLIHTHAAKSPHILKQTILGSLANFQQTELLTDDVTLAVIKFEQNEAKPRVVKDWKIQATIPFKYKADTIHLADISHQITSACRTLVALPPDSKGDDFVYLVELAVSEICTNMIEHAYAGMEGLITGQITLTNVGIQIDIFDQGHGFNPKSVPPPISDPMDPTEGGYGLHIVRQIMDIAEYEANTSRGNHWKLIKYLPA